MGAALVLQPLAGCSQENNGEAVVTNQRSDSMPVMTATPAADGKLILAFGDSLYAGYGVLPQQSFPFRLEQALRDRGVAVSVRNAGISGDTTAAGLRRLKYTLDGLTRTPDLAMVNLGGNDMLRGVPVAETRANLTAICEELQRRGIPILLTGMIAAPNMGRDYAAPFNAIYPDLAKRFDAVLYPFFLDGVVLDRTLMLPDRVHPNPKGIAIIVDKVAPVVAKAIEQAKA